MNEFTSSCTRDRLAEAIAAAIADNTIAADGRAVRRDGWTAERMRIFLEALADHGSVTHAAREAGVSARSAYKLRDRAPEKIALFEYPEMVHDFMLIHALPEARMAFREIVRVLSS